MKDGSPELEGTWALASGVRTFTIITVPSNELVWLPWR
jgi:hypothetical protein